MKIVLIRPPEINRVWAGIPDFFNEGIFLFPPLGLMQLKAYIERYSPYEVILYDSLIHRADYGKVAKFIKEVSPEVAGISTFTHSLADVVKAAAAIKEVKPSIHITVGGPHTYAFPGESAYLLNSGYIDSVVLGDGEEAFNQLLYALDKQKNFTGIDGIIYKNNGEIIKKGGPVFIKDLDALPFPSRNIYGFQHYYTPASSGKLMTTIITSRGCPYSCLFCDTQKKYRTRSVKNIVDEMELCSKFGFREVFFIDDTFNVTTDRVIQLSEEILKRGLSIKWGFKARCDNVDRRMLVIARKAGCFRIHYGVETGLDSGLSSINKKITLDAAMTAFIDTKKLGIRTTAYFMIGCPHEKNISDVMETINFACNLKADFAVFSLLSPYPDTAFYRKGIEKGLIDPVLWNMFVKKPDVRYDLPTCWEEYFSKAELIRLLRLVHRKFYYRPRIIFNALFNILSFREFMRLIKGVISLFKLEFLSGNNKDF